MMIINLVGESLGDLSSTKFKSGRSPNGESRTKAERLFRVGTPDFPKEAGSSLV